MCSHPERRDIDAAAVAGEPNRRIAARYGLSETAVRRHKRDHLPAALLVAHQADAVTLAGDLLAEVQRIHTSTLDVLRAAEAAADHRTALLAVRECRGNIELLARLVTAAIVAEREAATRAEETQGDSVAALSDEELDRQIEAAMRALAVNEGWTPPGV